MENLQNIWPSTTPGILYTDLECKCSLASPGVSRGMGQELKRQVWERERERSNFTSHSFSPKLLPYLVTGPDMSANAPLPLECSAGAPIQLTPAGSLFNSGQALEESPPRHLHAWHRWLTNPAVIWLVSWLTVVHLVCFPSTQIQAIDVQSK